MFSSMGYHTFAVSMNLTKEEATRLFNDFKKYRDRTQKICIIECPKCKKDPSGRHYEVKYLGQYKGISWRIRFSNSGFMMNGQYMSCSVKAIINPKILTGEKSYIMAANAGYLERIEEIFNTEAKRISPVLREFGSYSLNRLDYCINIAASEVRTLPVECGKDLPKKIMQLIRYGDIPKKFSMGYDDKYQFYLKSGTVVINCYWKYPELVRDFEECDDLEESRDIIRFEVQYKYPKIIQSIEKIKKNPAKYRIDTIRNLDMQTACDSDEPIEVRDMKCRQSVELLSSCPPIQLSKKMYMINMMADEMCMNVIKNYYNKTIKPGDYYSYHYAERIILNQVSKGEKIYRLTDALKLIREKGGIANAKAGMCGNDLEEFCRSLRDLRKLRINPVLIPDEWGIDHIQNLFDAYYDQLNKEDTLQWSV